MRRKAGTTVILAIVCSYLALGAFFYFRLTATATDVAAPSKWKNPPTWHRARRVTADALRRVRPHLPRR